jgi:hypothetical protein
MSAGESGPIDSSPRSGEVAAKPPEGQRHSPVVLTTWVGFGL